ncbi:ABC transporter substrate-binding protein [Sphaerimonospora sp. CA-214678]|uniref:ABC transporter substrate-binding protein n=1 Tax=Sphaerimonospora sp. CA-214678 TaxID=3240029 RepID=UPI003D8D5E5B
MKLSTASLAKKLTLAGVVAALVAGCGSNGGGTVSDGDLKGEPIKLGSILTITNPAWGNQVMKDVNDAFTSYINKDLGGIDGRPVSVETCDDHGDPAKTSQCLNNLLDSGVVAFVNNSSLAFGANALPAMEKAGLVNVGGWPVTPAEYASDHEFLTAPGASGSYPSLAAYFRSRGAETLAMMYQNTPAGQTAADDIKAFWSSIGGTTFTGVEFDPTAPDFTPAVSKAVAGKPDAIILAVGEGPAPRLFQALDVSNTDAMIGVTAAAGGKKVQDAAGAALDGVYFSVAAVPADYDREDARTYSKVMKEYSPETELNNQAAVAASGMMAIYDILKGISGEISKASVLAAVQKTTTWDGFLTHGYDRSKAPKELPAVGNPFNLVTNYQGGKFSPAEIKEPGAVARYLEVDGELTWISGSPTS